MFNDSVNVVSFGLVATTILISMFLVMAIFESLIRNTTKLTNSYFFSRSGPFGLESRVGLNGLAFSKISCESPMISFFSFL
ncbi:hypothetical protein DY000_02031538 [Brassica cretica]|uniref:Uncharacterized protein n=1 Tax=Brassica cretica TaxID=69181 RepID=A0ABQ7DPM6_BRACR|nr:hypothetical protein DY000_02031538 [Brassica cretica]